MGILSRIFGWKGREPERPVGQFKSNDSLDDLIWGNLGLTAPSVTGIYVNQHTALNSSAVMAAVTMLSEDVAKLPWSIFKNADGEARKEETNHYLYDLLEQPNEWQNGFEFREQMQVSLILRGNAYAIMPRNGRGIPVAMIPVNADWVSLWTSPDGQLFYRVVTMDIHLSAMLRRYNMPPLIPHDDVLHIRGFSMNGLMGLSRIFLAREAIALFLAQEQQAARWMGNSARPSGMLTTDQKLTPEGAKRLAADIRENWGGLQNSGKVIIGEQGLKFLPYSMSANDLQHVASRTFQLEEIGRIFRIPPHMLGQIGRAASNTISQMAQEYVNFTLTGYTDRWRAKFSSAFDLKRQGLSIEFDYNKITQADITARINNWRTAIMSMIAKPDEARIDLGLPAEGGDAAKLHYPVNLAVEGSQASGVAPDGAGHPAADDSPVVDPSPAKHLRAV